MKVAVVYWSSTGNTEAMAEAVAKGAKNSGAEVSTYFVSKADKSILDSDVILLGCPAMGAEELEEIEFEPFFSSIESELTGKKIGLFGSYDWGDGEWMRLWQERVIKGGAILVADGLTVQNTPDDDGLKLCEELGEKAVK